MSWRGNSWDIAGGKKHIKAQKQIFIGLNHYNVASFQKDEHYSLVELKKTRFKEGFSSFSSLHKKKPSTQVMF